MPSSGLRHRHQARPSSAGPSAAPRRHEAGGGTRPASTGSGARPWSSGELRGSPALRAPPVPSTEHKWDPAPAVTAKDQSAQPRQRLPAHGQQNSRGVGVKANAAQHRAPGLGAHQLECSSWCQFWAKQREKCCTPLSSKTVSLLTPKPWRAGADETWQL